MIGATLNGNPCSTIATCYRSTNVSDETDITIFYIKQSSHVQHFAKYSVLIIGRDMNAQINKNVTTRHTNPFPRKKGWKIMKINFTK